MEMLKSFQYVNHLFEATFLSVFILPPATMWMQYLLLFMEDGQQSSLT